MKDVTKDYATEKRKARRKGNGGTAEFFTPASLVKHMCDKVDADTWADPTKTFLEPSAGNGAFCVEIVRRRIEAGVDWKETLRTLYAVELMPDNVAECKDNIINTLHSLGVEFDESAAREILEEQIVCHDFFTWNFDEWRPYTEDELKPIKKTSKKAG